MDAGRAQEFSPATVIVSRTEDCFLLVQLCICKELMVEDGVWCGSIRGV